MLKYSWNNGTFFKWGHFDENLEILDHRDHCLGIYCYRNYFHMWTSLREFTIALEPYGKYTLWVRPSHLYTKGVGL